jgi:chemotaxis protein methyltransferase CheR
LIPIKRRRQIGGWGLTPTRSMPYAGSVMPAVSTDPVASIMRLAKELAGIDLSEAKRSMVESRLGKRLRHLACDMTAYARLVHEDHTEQMVCLDLLTTNHTAWLREPSHFEDLERRVLPALRGRRLRIWCAAAATGEEPYTIALCLARSLPEFASWDAGILATDLSTRALGRASDAVYADDRVAALSPSDRQLALELADQGPPRQWRVRPELRRLVNLARLNLMDDTWPMRGPFEVIFCRNVMIYFDRATQERLVNRLATLLVPGGTLYVGHSESLSAIRHPLRMLAPATYQRA